MGMISEKFNVKSEFYSLTRIRLACKEAHARMDCSRKFASVIHRKAAPVSGEYAVGDLI